LSHEKPYENQIYEFACIKTLGSEIIHGDIYPKLEENNEEE